MRILLVTDRLMQGGVWANYQRLAKYYLESGHSVCIVCLFRRGGLQETLDPRIQLKVIRLPTLAGRFIGLTYHLWRSNPSLTIGSKELVNVFLYWAHRLARLRTPVVVTVNSMISIQMKEKRGLLWKLFKVAMKLTLQKAPNIAAVSEAAAHDLKDKVLKQPGKSIHVIYNPVFDDQSQSGTLPLPNHDWYRSREGKRILLGVGRLHEEKNLSHLVDCLANLNDRSTYLMILGEGPDAQAIKDKAERLGLADRVCVYGYAKNVQDFLAHSDLLLVPSLHEGFCNVIVEAMAVGCPVLSNLCPGGPAEILANGRYGTLLDSLDPALWGKAIEDALQKPTNKDALLSRAKEFSIRRAAEDFLSFA